MTWFLDIPVCYKLTREGGVSSVHVIKELADKIFARVNQEAKCTDTYEKYFTEAAYCVRVKLCKFIHQV